MMHRRKIQELEWDVIRTGHEGPYNHKPKPTKKQKQHTYPTSKPAMNIEACCSSLVVVYTYSSTTRA